MLKWEPKAKQNLNFFNKFEGPWFVTSGKVMGIGWHGTSSCGQESHLMQCGRTIGGNLPYSNQTA